MTQHISTKCNFIKVPLRYRSQRHEERWKHFTICGFVIIGSRYATFQHAVEKRVYQLPFQGLDRDVPLSAPDLIELWLGTVKTSRDSGRINLAEWFDDDEGIRYCLEDAFISPVMDWREVVCRNCGVNPKIGDKETGATISIRSDGYSNLPIAQGAGSHERLDRRLPNAVLSFHRISQIHNFGFRQNDTAVASFSLTFDDRRITFAKRAETGHHFIERLVFALQRAHGDLSQVTGNEVGRTDQCERILQKFAALQAPAR